MGRKNCSNIGGSAVIEGVMMRGKSVAATAVRDQKGNLQVESERFTPMVERNKAYKVPVLRGVLNFIGSMGDSMKYILRSSEVFAAGIEEEESKFEKWLSKKFKIDLMDIVTTVSAILGVLLAIGLFVFIPQLITDAIFAKADVTSFGMQVAFNAVAGGIRMTIFVLYIYLISLMKDVKRLFMYHGAEHKTITCYENGLELTVENVRQQKRVHDRCGTTFMFLVMMLSIFFFMFFPVDFIKGGNAILNYILRVLFRIACIPIVAGLSYEALKLFAKFDNALTKVLKAPGLLLQKLTTREPDDEMIEVAIAAFTTVLKMEEDPTIEVTYFDTSRSVAKVKADFLRVIGEDKEDKVELVMLDTLGLEKKSDLYDGRKIKESDYIKMKANIKRLKKGEPPQYISGLAYFYGRAFEVDSNVLIPRIDTERLAEESITAIKSIDDAKVLELCTGSGAVATTIALECDVKVVATDISTAAIEVAQRNASRHSADIETRIGHMFEALDDDMTFDVIVANPPYIPTKDMDSLDIEVKNYEPHIALDGGADGLVFYRLISQNFAKYLRSGGTLLLEVGIGQAKDVAAMFSGYDVTIKKDYNNPPIDRVVIVKDRR